MNLYPILSRFARCSMITVGITLLASVGKAADDSWYWGLTQSQPQPQITAEPASVSCKTYSGPGTYIVKPCDQITGPRFTIYIEKILPSEQAIPIVIGHIQYNFDGKLSASSFDTEASGNMATQSLRLYLNSRLGIAGGFVDHKLPSNYDSNHPTMQFTVYPDCSSLYAQCVAREISLPGAVYSCDQLCPADAQLAQHVYAATKDIRVSAPENYSILADLIARDAQNCYDKITNLVGQASSHPIHIPIAVMEVTGCQTGGNVMGMMPCGTSSDFSDTNIVHMPAYLEDIASINANKCFNSEIVGALPHELVHNFALSTFVNMNSEGLARFVEFIIDDNLFTNLTCLNDGYVITMKSTGKPQGEMMPYGKFASNNYNGGGCFYSDLKKEYGEEGFKNIFAAARNISHGSPVHFFQDIINPALRDDVYEKFKMKYGIETDPKVSNFLLYNVPTPAPIN